MSLMCLFLLRIGYFNHFQFDETAVKLDTSYYKEWDKKINKRYHYVVSSWRRKKERNLTTLEKKSYEQKVLQAVGEALPKGNRIIRKGFEFEFEFHSLMKQTPWPLVHF